MATKCMVSVIMLASVLSILIVNAAPNANVITVGDEKGWTLDFDYQAWAQNKQFHVGETLVFNYPKGAHNVIMVDGSGFQNCDKTPNSGILESGQDKIVLNAAGNMWFLCGVGDHCESGQKLKITVTESSLPFPIPFPPAPSPARKSLYSNFPFIPSTPGPAPSPLYSINFPFHGASPAPAAARAA